MSSGAPEKTEGRLLLSLRDTKSRITAGTNRQETAANAAENLTASLGHSLRDRPAAAVTFSRTLGA